MSRHSRVVCACAWRVCFAGTVFAVWVSRILGAHQMCVRFTLFGGAFARARVRRTHATKRCSHRAARPESVHLCTYSGCSRAWHETGPELKRDTEKSRISAPHIQHHRDKHTQRTILVARPA